MNIYVGNLSYGTQEGDLKDLFGTFGEVEYARIIKDKESGRSKGFGFVEMPNADEAKAAIEALNGKQHQNRNIVVNEARPREDKPRSFR